MPSTPRSIISSKKARTDLGFAPSNSVVLVVTRKPRLQGFFDGIDGDVVSAFAADGEVVLFALAVEVDGERQILAGLEEMDFLFQKQSVGAEIDIFFAGDETGDNFADLRVHERFATGDRDHGGAAFVDGAETFFGGKILL